MKRLAWQLSICGILEIAALPSHGQEGGLRVRITFQIFVAERTLPAGEYGVASVGERGLLVQNTMSRKDGLIVLAEHLRGHRFDGPGDLIFTCYDNRCFLSQAWTFGGDVGRELPKS